MLKEFELLKELCEAFGPSGCEEEVAALIQKELAGSRAEFSADPMGNLICHLPGKPGTPRVMLSAHMDEVGFMITRIEESGLLRASTVGGIDPRVMGGRSLQIGEGEKRIRGVLAALGIHFESREDREKQPLMKDHFISIGAADRQEAEKLVERGDYATFTTQCELFGENNAFVKGKALDDRAGCAILIETLRAVEKADSPYDLYFCFTVREELGQSGASPTAVRIRPDLAVVLETTAVADIPSVPEARRVAELGKGGVISFMDKGSIYNKKLVNTLLSYAESKGIAAQPKRFVSGSNDASKIQRTLCGVQVLAFSAPTRYLHAPVTVAKYADIVSMRDLLIALLTEKEDVLCINSYKN